MVALRERMGLDGKSIESMRRLVNVESDDTSGLVEFTTTSSSAEGAAAMANTLVELFLDHHRRRRGAEIRALIASLDDRIAAAQGELRDARTRYDAFREQNRITNLSAEQEQAITQAAALRSEADLAQAEVQGLEARVAQLRVALARTPRMQATSTESADDATRLTELRARLQEARGSLSDEHPEVQALKRQVASLRREMSRGGGETTRIGVSTLHESLRASLAEAETELEAARRRSESLEDLAAQAQERTNRFSAIEGQAATLLAHVNVKQALLEELSKQKARAEDELRDIQTGFYALAEARPPESAVRSKKKYAVAAAFPMGLVALVFVALLYRELRGLLVQTPAETAWWGNGPVIGATTWPRDPRALIDLIADMDDFAPEARGTMLVVGSTELERDLAVEIAGQLNHDWGSTALVDVPVIGALPPPPHPTSSPTPDGSDAFDDEKTPLRAQHDDATELVLRGSYDLDFIGSGELAPYAHEPRDIDDPTERLVCTAWSGASEGQALRRAARLADRVLVVVTSNAMRATELAQMKKRLGREHAVGYVLVAVSDEVARLPDRAGPVEEFWEGGAAK